MRIRVRRPAILRRRTHALRLVVRWRRHGAVAPRRESAVQRLNVRLPLCDIWSEDFAIVGQETIDFTFNIWRRDSRQRRWSGMNIASIRGSPVVWVHTAPEQLYSSTWSSSSPKRRWPR